MMNTQPVIHAAAALIRDKDRILAIKVSEGTDRGRWKFPDTLKEENETAEHAVRRIVQDTLGLLVHVSEERIITDTNRHGASVHTEFCLSDITEGEAALQERTDVRWMKAEELNDADWIPADRSVIPLIQERYQTNRTIGKFLSLILRHKPEAVGITLDEHGWANVDELVRGVSGTHPLDRKRLEEIVITDNKGRFSYNRDKTAIRANQGHSIAVDVELEERFPPEYLWHGTGQKYTASIEKSGLLPKTRQYVHLSVDYDTAVSVGSRHGKPVVYLVESGAMAKDGYRFFRSVNGVWLTKEVPALYLRRTEK